MDVENRAGGKVFMDMSNMMVSYKQSRSKKKILYSCCIITLRESAPEVYDGAWILLMQAGETRCWDLGQWRHNIGKVGDSTGNETETDEIR